MVSTKYLRRPERGALGNGLRVIVGCVLASGGMIEIDTRGKQVVLRPRRVGPTEIVSAAGGHKGRGTTRIVVLGDAIPHDDADLFLAQAAIDLAQCTDRPPYARQPSPHWIDADAFTEALILIDLLPHLSVAGPPEPQQPFPARVYRREVVARPRAATVRP